MTWVCSRGCHWPPACSPASTTRASTFAENDHRNYNREGQAFDVGETFAGLDYDAGLEFVAAVRELVPAGATTAQLALRWILMHEGVTAAIPGAKDPAQARANAAAADLAPLSDETHGADRRALRAAAPSPWCTSAGEPLACRLGAPAGPPSPGAPIRQLTKDTPLTTHAPEPSLQELDPALALPHRRKMEILFAVLLVVFLSALDQTIVGVALPRIVGDLGGTNELYTWVITSYLLTATITGVFYGKLSDIYGRRLMLLFGVSVFLLGSVLCGLSWNDGEPGRLPRHPGHRRRRHLPHLAGGHRRPLRRRASAVATRASSARSSASRAVLGPFLGGFITDSLGWHWIFFVNLPIGARHALHRVALPALGPRRAARRATSTTSGAARLRGRRGVPAAGPDQQADRASGPTSTSAASSSSPRC